MTDPGVGDRGFDGLAGLGRGGWGVFSCSQDELYGGGGGLELGLDTGMGERSMCSGGCAS